MNKHSGLIGISGVSSDMRQIIKEAGEGHKNCRLALDIFCYRLRKYIGAYATALGGLDAIVFTGGIGQNARPVRVQTCEDLGFMGVQVDAEANEACDGKTEACISKPNSPVQVWVIPTNEELVIARDTAAIVGKA
jgi:acetate kinase